MPEPGTLSLTSFMKFAFFCCERRMVEAARTIRQSGSCTSVFLCCPHCGRAIELRPAEPLSRTRAALPPRKPPASAVGEPESAQQPDAVDQFKTEKWNLM